LEFASFQEQMKVKNRKVSASCGTPYASPPKKNKKNLSTCLMCERQVSSDQVTGRKKLKVMCRRKDNVASQILTLVDEIERVYSERDLEDQYCRSSNNTWYINFITS